MFTKEDTMIMMVLGFIMCGIYAIAGVLYSNMIITLHAFIGFVVLGMVIANNVDMLFNLVEDNYEPEGL